MTGNFNSKQVSLRSCMRSKYFILGFNDYRQGKPFKEITDRNKNFQFNYERGRQFAAACPDVVKVKDGRTINSIAYHEASVLFSLKHIL